MSILSLTITQTTAPTFDGGTENLKDIVATIDGTELSDVGSYDATRTDEQVKTDFKTFLTSKGYTWDSEV